MAVAFSPDGTSVVTGTDDRTARRWGTAGGGRIGPPLEHPPLVRFVAFSPDGRLIRPGGDSTVRLWDTATGKPVGDPLPQDSWAARGGLQSRRQRPSSSAQGAG